jgi:hypothetical protein
MSALNILSHKNFWLNVCTAVGAFGGMPDPPKFFKFLYEKIPGFKWFLVFVLIYQGGGEQDLGVALQITIVFIVLKYGGDYIWDLFDNNFDTNSNKNNNYPIYY